MRSLTKMNIDRYYRDIAQISLNGSIAALLPAIGIILGNILVFRHEEIMLLSIPFIFYSFVQFQLYLYRFKQSSTIHQVLEHSKKPSRSFFAASELLVFYLSTPAPQLFLYFPDGSLAGVVHARPGKRLAFFGNSKTYVLVNPNKQIMGLFKITKDRKRTISVYDASNFYLGNFEVSKRGFIFQKAKSEVVDSTGRFVGAVEGARLYMDERLLDNRNHSIGRLRRGWMPLEWSLLFPEANTPVFTLSPNLSENEKLLRYALLINAYFIER